MSQQNIQQTQQMYPSHYKLVSGQEMPVCGLGLYRTDLESLQNLLQHALDQGYRHFDTAIHYGNEKEVGQAFANIFKQGKYKREEVFITSKVMPRNDWDMVDMVKQSLQDLQIEYIDLFLIHWPSIRPGDDLEIKHKPVHQVWGELEKAVEQGLAKDIGVSNFNVQMLYDLLAYCKVKPAMNQVELHLYLQQPKLIDFCSKFGVNVTAYCPLGRGSGMLDDENIISLAKKYNKSPAQIALHHLVCNLGVAVIPKTSNPKRLLENIDWRDFKMSEDDIQQLKDMDKGIRFMDPSSRWEVPLFH